MKIHSRLSLLSFQLPSSNLCYQLHAETKPGFERLPHSDTHTDILLSRCVIPEDLHSQPLRCAYQTLGRRGKYYYTSL